ncbi:MAG: acetate/propionate family kinase [Polaribacter sp.]
MNNTNVLVINSGSSSLKFQVFEMPEQRVLCKGNVERIGLEDSIFSYETKDGKRKETLFVENHSQALLKIADQLTDKKDGILTSTDDIHVVGHRVVHGGSKYTDATIITDEVKEQIKNLFDLAPLHNPLNYIGIEIAEEIFPNAKQVASFDTAFHQTMPKVAYQYAIPNSFLDEHGIRAYGFHGNSHKFVSEKAYEYIKNPSAKVITIHLGNGCSMSAIKDGNCIENSLGFGPMNGLVMGTRSGDIDQSVIFYLQNNLNYSVDNINTLLQKKSGLQGLTGLSDVRDIQEKAESGDEKCQFALELMTYRIKKYIGSYSSALNGVDALVFTAGIGENSAKVRAMVCENMDYLGVQIDPDKNNNTSGGIDEIQAADSKVKILVIPTNEELEIAKQSYNLVYSLEKS